MTEISTEELARWLETFVTKNGEGAMDANLTEAAARLRALAEDAERLDWLETCDARWMLAGNYGHLSYVRNVRGVDQRVDRQGNNLRQAIDKARHD